MKIKQGTDDYLAQIVKSHGCLTLISQNQYRLVSWDCRQHGAISVIHTSTPTEMPLT